MDRQNEAPSEALSDALRGHRTDAVLANDSTEVKQMEQRTDHSIAKGSPELALLLFALLAVFAYLVF